MVLSELCTANIVVLKFANNFKYLIGSYHYFFMAANNILLFVITQRKTNPFLRYISSILFALSSQVIIFGFSVFSLIYINSYRIQTPLNRFLYYCSARHQLKMVNLQIQHETNQIGLQCYRVFVFTSYRIIKILFTFVLNVILLVDLFENYIH